MFSAAEQRCTARAYGGEPIVVPEAAHDLMLGPHWDEAARAILTRLER